MLGSSREQAPPFLHGQDKGAANAPSKPLEHRPFRLEGDGLPSGQAHR